jgi:hypothetical protein
MKLTGHIRSPKRQHEAYAFVLGLAEYRTWLVLDVWILSPMDRDGT